LIDKSILLVIAGKDFNEDEYLVVKKIFEREGFKIFITSDAQSLCVGNRGMKVRADVSFFNMKESNFAAVVVIGGNGIKKYWDNLQLHNLVIAFNKANKIVAAICSGPIVISRSGILTDKKATCYQNDIEELKRDGVEYIDIPVVFSKNIITAQDVSAAQEFSQTIAERLK